MRYAIVGFTKVSFCIMICASSLVIFPKNPYSLLESAALILIPRSFAAFIIDDASGFITPGRYAISNTTEAFFIIGRFKV